MNTMPLSFQSAIKQPTKAAESKISATATAKTETIDFAQMLNAVSSSPAEAQPANTDQQEELMGKLETLLTSLEELPQEGLTPEQQEMLQAIMQLLAQQLQPAEEKVQSTELMPEEAAATGMPQSSIDIEEPVKKELVLTVSALEKLKSNPADQEKLTGLLEEAAEALQKAASATPRDSGSTEMPVDAEKLEQVFVQLTSLIKDLETDQQKTETKTAAVQVQQLEQVLKQVTGLKQEPIQMVQPKEIQQPAAIQAGQNPIEAQAVPEEVMPKQQEAPALASSAEPAQPIAPAGTETTKNSPALQRPEPNVPQATVRMSNLVEELGDILRGSFRLNGEGDSKQIRISIFPEHLGHMDIRLTQVDGKIVAQLFTSSLAAKEALDQQANLLRSSMMQQGITVEKIEISQQSSQQSFGQQNAYPDQRSPQQQKQGLSARTRNGYQRIEEDAAAIVRQQSNDGSTMKVDYTI